MTEPHLQSADDAKAARPARDEYELVRRAQQREPEACRELVRRYYDEVYRLAYRFLSSPEDADDIAQETFLRVFAAIDRFDLELRFRPWVHRIAMNLVTDAIRRRYRSKMVPLAQETDAPADGADPSDGPSSREEHALVRRVVDSLPPKYRTVLVLRDMEGYETEEIASMLNCPRATVRWRLHQARKMFKRQWERIQP